MEEDSGKLGLTEQQFLFRDEEFDDGDFDAAQFVARYRRVTSLESLREQLVSFNQHVQKQLYSIINRDYKDFITISTKLDGLDTRAEMMMKPMFGLQMDMSSLQNGISGSLHLIQDKIDEQREIARKKTTIQKLLRVSSNMDLAKSALNMSTLSDVSSTQWTKGSSGSDAAATSSRRNRLYRQAHHVVESHEKDLFVCSEYERAAIALKESQDDLTTISQNITSLQNTVSPSMVQELQRNFEITKENLVANVKTHLEHYFSAASTEKRSQSHGTAAPVPDVATQTQRRCYGHCLRAVLSLGRGDIAEGALRTAVVEPYVKNALSVGKVDGKLGRGTYSGLESALNDMIAWLETSYLGELLSMADEIATMLGGYHDAKPASFNLIANGVWQPVVQVLQERFPTMQSVGITSVFSHCFRAVDLFAQHLLRVYPHSGARGLRLAVQQYFKTWKLELYSQLRSREVMTRVDAICVQLLPAVAAGAGKQAAKGDILSLAYTVTAAAASSAATTAAGSAASTEVASTNTMQKNRLQTATSLASPHLEEVWRDMVELAVQTQLTGTTAGKHSGGFHHELYQALSMETCLVTHPHVALKPVATQCLGLVLRVVQRVVYHVVLLCNASSFPLTTAPAVGSDEATGDAVEATVKGSTGVQSFEQLRNEYLGAELASSSTNTAAMSSEELLGHWHDLLHFHALAGKCLEERVLPRLFAFTADASEAKVTSLRRQLVSSILQPILQAAEAVWKRIVSLTAQDCKRPLSTAVKAIAGKYRMTNKPAPTSASPYVGTILEPLEKLLRLKTSPEVLVQTMARLLPAASASSVVTWKEQLCEDLTQVYQEQIVTLLDTVRQMDSALQRRQQQRGKAASASGAGGSGDASGTSAILTDSDKIYLQVKLDVQEYGRTMGALLGERDEAALASKVPSLSAIATILDQATNRSTLSNPPSGKLGSAQNNSAALSSEDPQGSSPNAIDSISQPTSLN